MAQNNMSAYEGIHEGDTTMLVTQFSDGQVDHLSCGYGDGGSNGGTDSNYDADGTNGVDGVNGNLNREVDDETDFTCEFAHILVVESMMKSESKGLLMCIELVVEHSRGSCVTNQNTRMG